jgi:plasmid maintenance system antidote protein VapI
VAKSNKMSEDAWQVPSAFVIVWVRRHDAGRFNGGRGREEDLSTNDGLPQARRDGLVVRELPDEVLVYDLESHKAHCLNSTAAAVWRLCDGETTVADMAFRLAREVGEPVDEDVVWLALEDLSRLELLERKVVRAESGLSRAQLVRRVGVVTATLAIPAVLSLGVPTASAALCNDVCAGNPDCPASCPNCVGTCQP